jgi:hypothetical protein
MGVRRPLAKVTDSDFRQLCQVLWSWPQCDKCQDGKPCPNLACPFKRVKRLIQFKEYYKNLVASYEPDIARGEHPALRTQEDIFALIRGLRSKPNVSRAAFADDWFTKNHNRTVPPADDQDRAINLAVKVMAMVNCSAQHQSPGLLEHGAFQRRWQNDVALTQFMTDAFPMSDHPSLNDTEAGAGLDMKSALVAKKLKKRARLWFRPTNDLRCHLKLDRKTGAVDIFHHTAFLKEQLRLTKEDPRPVTAEDCLKL